LENAERSAEAENLDPWSLYIYAMKAPMTRDRYMTRLAKFSDFIDLKKLHYRARVLLAEEKRTATGDKNYCRTVTKYYYTDDSTFAEINNSFIESLKISPNDFASIIFASTSYDNEFRISSLVVKVPVININQVYQAHKIRLDET